MILCIADVLTASELEAINSQLESVAFIDGKATAGWHAQAVKHNTQLPTDHPVYGQLRPLVQQAVQRHELIRTAAWPKAYGPMLFSRYEPGMSYGSHVDNALMGGHTPIRTDLSVTLFLSDPSHYQGGELVIETSQGEEGFKLAAGSLILYPATTLHRVETVTAGIRLVAVTWIQSYIRDASAREILFDLETAKKSLFAREGKSPAFDLISKSQANLLRRWSEV